MLHIVLFQPDIPQNTGNIGRLCACAGLHLHLIHPLGFNITDKHLRRAGMDYWASLDIFEYDNWQTFMASKSRPQQLWLLTTRAQQNHWSVEYSDGDGLVFGKETAGSPNWLHQSIGAERSVRIPHFGDNKLRSLNLATSAGIVAYEALRQVRCA